MSFVDTLRAAHIEEHRVGHVCHHLTEPEKEVFERLKKQPNWELTEGGLTARLEPRRFGVNWRQALLDEMGQEYVDNLTDKARKRTIEARQKFEEEGPNWSEETLQRMRLVIIG